MNKVLNELSGYLKAFEVLNNGNYEGCDYFIEEVDFNGNELISLENFLMTKFNGKVEPSNLHYDAIKDWKKTLFIELDFYFFRNIKLNCEMCKYEFIKMIDDLIGERVIQVLASGIENGYSSISEYIGEVSGADFIFILDRKILILHFGIND